MDLIASCSSCGARFKFTDKYAGRTVKCPKCSGTIAVPQAGEGERSAGQASVAGQPGQEAPSAAAAAEQGRDDRFYRVRLVRMVDPAGL
jgi:predicted Zn finger-like uncharacterized protein